ncbi:MAG TPA: ATP-binding protein [Thermoanaerobaculia bacterium]|nr:ATP-binding protein [Thermoanaerobaculia bacterium]
MGVLVRAFDWSKTPLGPVGGWPQSLRTAVSILLSSRHPMFIWWGPELVQFYNDGYRPSLGTQMHPGALGQRGEECWTEIWPIIGPQIEGVMSQGQETWHEDQLVPFDRNGYLEEIYFTYGYSPIRDETGGVGGTLVVCTETTERVLAERRLRTLRDLAARSVMTERVEESCRLVAEVLAANPHDIPFALLYLLDEPRRVATLAGLAGIEPQTLASPARVDLERPGGEPAWPLARVAANGRAELVRDLDRSFGRLSGGAWPVPPHSALVLPVTLPGHELPSALLVAALSPRRALDEGYRTFLDLAAGQVATALAHARVHEEERRQAETLAEAARRERELRAETAAAAGALRDSEERYRTLTDAVQQLMWINDADGRALHYNQRWQEYFGDTLAEHGGRRWLDLVHPDDLGAVTAARAAGLAREEAYELEYRLKRHDGEYRWHLARVVPQKDADGRVLGWFGTATDIHDVKRAEAELRQAKEAAEAANQAKDRFLATLSHELRTPLTPVLAVVSRLAEESGLAGPLREELARVQRNVELEARLIDDLLDLTRIARGKLELHREIVDLGQLIGQALDTCGPDLAERLAVTLDLGDGDHRVWGDGPRLAQVFWNLLNNAVKFTPAGGTLSLRSSRPAPGRLAVEVADSGIGIDPEVLPRIFDGFEQGERTITRRFGGLGLGLAISKAIVELHGGSLRVASGGRGQGATFTVELPAGMELARPAGPALPATGEERKAASQLPLHILLVEDHLDTALAMAELLRALGHRVTTAAGVGAGLAAAAVAMVTGNGSAIDLVVSDLGLPDGSGHDLMRELKSRYGLSGIALSGYGMEEDVHQSREAGFDRHLTKPVSIQVLAAAIRESAKDRAGASAV